MKKLLGLLLFVLSAALLLSGCAKPASRCVSPEDSPEHHYLAGMELLEKDDLDGAGAKFQRAVYCEKKYAPAHAGLAIVTAKKANISKPDGYRSADIDETFEHLKDANRYSGSNEELFTFYLASLRVSTELKTKGWLSEAEQDYKDSMKVKVDENRLIYYGGREAATYFMGLAYLEAREFQQARDKFSEVLNSRRDGKWHAPADRQWKRADKIVRALSGITLADVGKEIALKDSVDRGDMAALLVDELKLESLFAGRIPARSEVEALKADFVPADTLSSPFRHEVLTLMKWKVRGLEPVYDNATRAYLFKPGDPVTRKEFALALEDILIKITADENIASAYFGHERSPFPDVPPSSAAYNAIMSVTTRNIMETELSGEFRPDDAVDGAEAVLAVRVLRQRLNIH